MVEEVADRFWREFESEAGEHLDALEAGLMGFVEGRSAENVAPVFRALHSLKGLARAMGLTGLEQASHAAESVLQHVRDKSIPAGLDIIDALFRSHDTMRRQLSAAISTHEDQPPPPHVLAALTALQRSLEEQDPPEVAAGDVDESDEGEEMLKLFGELLENSLHRIAEIFDAPDETRRVAVADAFAEISQASEVMGFDALRATVESLAGFAAEEFPREMGPRREAAIEAFSNLLTDVRIVEEVAGITGTVGILTAAADRSLRSDLDATEAVLHAALRDMRGTLGGGHMIPPAVFASFTAAVGRYGILLGCVGEDAASDLTVLMQEVCTSLAARIHGDVASDIEAIAEVLERLAQTYVLSESERSGLVSVLRRALTGAGETRQVGLIAGVDVGSDMRDLLDDGDVERLRQYLEEGETAYRWSLYLEAAQDVANAIIGWMTEVAHPIHSRTIFRDGNSWFEFLLTSRIDPNDLLNLVMRLDPGGSCIKRIVALDGTREGSAVLGGAAQDKTRGVVETAASSMPPERRYFRVRGEAVDGLIGSMAALRTRLADLGEIIASRRQTNGVLAPSTATTADAYDPGLALLKSLERRMEEVEADAYDLQVVALDVVLSRLPRIVHALGQQQKKLVRLRIEHGGIRADKAIVDLLLEPLVHLITNAVDHGIESLETRAANGKPEIATVSVDARKAGGELVLTIRDDGRGMNTQAILRTAVAKGLIDKGSTHTLTPKDIFQLTLRPGFSTAATLTDVSGRGVGLDVVATTIERLDGFVEIDSTEGEGTTFRLRLPLSRSLQSMILVEAGDQTFAFNERSVIRLLLTEARDSDEGTMLATVHSDGDTWTDIKVIPLGDLLWQHGPADACGASSERSIVLIGSDHEVLGVAVTKVVGRRNMAMRAPSARLLASRIVAGATTLVDGRVVLVLDAPELMLIARRGQWRGAPVPIYAA